MIHVCILLMENVFSGHLLSTTEWAGLGNPGGLLNSNSFLFGESILIACTAAFTLAW